MLLTFAAFAAAANREEIGVVVVSASAEPLNKIAAIKTAKNFIVGPDCEVLAVARGPSKPFRHRAARTTLHHYEPIYAIS